MDNLFYDKQGKPISSDKWNRLYQDLTYRIIRQDKLAGGIFISTVWLGISHNYPTLPPAIYETMIFVGGESEYMCRYATESAAFAGHQYLYVTMLLNQKLVNMLPSPKKGVDVDVN